MIDERIVQRVAALEERVNAIEKTQAVSHTEFTQIKGDLKDIKDSIKWVNRLIIGALILAVVTFIIGGGLVVPTV